jgi:CPA2 family monovalent cation:H+ antiporter-2
LQLGAVLTALALLGAVARRFALSPIPVYLLAGLALGNGGIAPVAAANEFVTTGAPIGVVLLLLTLGLEFSAAEFASSLRHHVPSAAVDIVLNAIPGALAGWLLGLDGVGVLALAGVTYVSSSGLIARLLEDLHRLGNRETPAVLSVLVLEDFAMAAYLPLFAVLASHRSWLLAVGSMAVAIVALWVAFAASYRWGHHVGRLVGHADSEQLLLRVLGITLIVAALAEHVHASAAVGAFLVGLTLTGETADRARKVLGPLRDLFAAIFFLAIGLSVNPQDLLPALPVAVVLATVTAVTKVATGAFAARREGVARRGQLRAGTTLIARAEFSLIIIGVVDSSIPGLAALGTSYVFVMAIVGPVLTRFTGGPSPAGGRGSRSAGEPPSPATMRAVERHEAEAPPAAPGKPGI